MVIAFYGSSEKFFVVPRDPCSASVLWSVACHVLKLPYFLKKNRTQYTTCEQGEENNPKEQKLLL